MDQSQEVTYLHLDDIIPNRFQPREVFDERALKELAISIKEHGVIQPIIVREISDNKYEIIAGERRYKASALAGLTKIPAIIRNLDDKEAAKVALLENLQRKNLNPIEEARTYQKIIELDEMTQEELAKTMGKSQSAVANKLRLLSLPDEIQSSLLKEEISERHARALINLDSLEEQKEMLKRVKKEKMTVRQLENEIKGKKQPQSAEIKQDELKNQEDLNSLINPNPVPVEKENISSSKNNSNTSFLMDPNFANEKKDQNDSIINYGEINDDEEEEEAGSENFKEMPTAPIDLDQLKANATDITDINEMNKKDEDNKNEVEKEKNTDLDSLLNITPPTENNFSPAQEALRESDNNNENKEDYFKAPDLMSINIPNSVSKVPTKEAPAKNSNNFNSLLDLINTSPSGENKPKKESLTDINQTLFQKEIEKDGPNKKTGKSLGMALMNEAYKNNEKNKIEQYNIQQMINEIRKTLSDLELHGAKIDTDEMNFENQYQILIKIDKNSNY